MNYRQIHLDFHTSELIPDIGKNFDKEVFAQELTDAHVDSITCFARGHHGWLYYPSKKHSHLIHPNLKNKNLLLEQIQACHAKGIKVPIYTTVQWDALVMREHPEWLAVGEDGLPIDTQQIGDPHFYFTICVNSDYRKFFMDNIEDIIDVVGAENVDGFFMDIVFQVDCNCVHCQKKMKELGMDTTDKSQRLKYSTIMLNEFKHEVAELIKSHVPTASVFYNSSHIGPQYKDSFKDYTHLELESLPSGGWGYEHFPITVRYARTLGKDIMGMTGKFHTYWGDFHSMKNPQALEFECFQMLAYGAGCSIGDQLHPYCALSKGSYDTIGKIYKSVEEKEPYCKGYKGVSEIAVLNPEEFYKEGHNLGISPAMLGVGRMLQELSLQYDIIDSEHNFNDYKLIILPDIIYHSEQLENTLKAYIKNGGKVIGSYDSCLDKSASSNIYGVEFVGKSPYYREFIMPNDVMGKSLYKEEYVMYINGYDVKATQAEELLSKVKPFFNREGTSFCSHQHTPSSGELTYPEATKNGNVIYFAHPIFELYRKNAPKWCKEIVKDAITLLLENQLVCHDGPTTLTASLTGNEDNYVLHFLHYITEKRSAEIFTITDVIPLYDTKCSVYVGDKGVKSIKLVPENIEIDFEIVNNYAQFTMEKISGHAMVQIAF